MLRLGNLVYCAPTSGGKSLVAEVLMLRAVAATGGTALLVLPFVSLCEEKVRQKWRVDQIDTVPDAVLLWTCPLKVCFSWSASLVAAFAAGPQHTAKQTASCSCSCLQNAAACHSGDKT